METLKDSMKALAEERLRVQELTIKASKIAEDLAQSELGKLLDTVEARLKDAKDEVTQLEQTIKSQAYLEWSEMEGHENNRRPWPGIEVKLFEVIKVTNEKAALAWAVQNMPSALTLNTRTLEKGVRALDLDFIEKKDEFRIQIASKLDEYLEK